MIAILVCANVSLLLALILGAGVPKADAQAGYGAILPNNTIMITGRIDQDEDALYILDLASERLQAWEFERKGNVRRMRPIGTRNVAVDLK